MNSKELYAIREWAPLTNVLDCIPTRINRGLFPIDLNITCIDAVEDFLALGSDAGIVFWYNRDSGRIQKLKAETLTRITCVSIVNSVEFMVAAGHSTGQVSVFQIQKELPADLNLVAPCTKSKPIERYTIRDLHQSAISCCEWSKNGMKLYSGDRQGLVVLTEIDYQAHLSKSIEILNEAYEIIQLSAHHGYLLVSTLYRSLICHRDTEYTQGKWVISQIGTKDRKQLVDCGGTFFKHSSTREPRLICGRPNLRFWLADAHGNVEKTFLFRDAVALSPTWEIPILNPKHPMHNGPLMQAASREECAAIGDARNFRNIYCYAGQDSLIVTHDERSLFILNLESLKVEAIAKGFRKIIDFCVCKKEIFVLEGERSLLRLAPMPEKPNKIAQVIYNPKLPPPVPILGASICGSFEAPVEYEPESQTVLKAEECFELPPIEALNLQIPIELAVESSKAEQNRRLEIFKDISQMDFDENILHHSSRKSPNNGIHHKKRHKTPDRQEGIVEIGHIVEQGQNVNNVEYTAQAMPMEASYCGKNVESAIMNLNFKQELTNYLPDMLSPTTLKETIAGKAKALAEELDLPEVCLQPITDEELRISKYLTPSPQTPYISSLDTIYPSEKHLLKDSCIQTTPKDKTYCSIEENSLSDYAVGQPIEDICHSLFETKTVAHGGTSVAKIEKREDKTPKPLSFVNANLNVTEDVTSFLLDFSKAKDPFQRQNSTSNKSENDSSNGGSSSEWEFLDN